MIAFQLLDGVKVAGFDPDVNFEADIKDICIDSRKVKDGDLFFAYAGTAFDSHDVAKEVYETGFVPFVVAERAVEGVPTVIVDDARFALAIACRNFFEAPDEELLKFAVTGTNGKTTVTYLAESILNAAGHKPIKIGTTGCTFAGETVDFGSTTPSAYEYYKILRDGVNAGCDSLVIEVSSHALTQHRVAGTVFDVAVFTNLSGDHLDYHKDMESYYEAKKTLFTEEYAKIAAVNIDHDYGMKLSKEVKIDLIKYGANERADITAEEIWFGIEGLRAKVKFPGESFNISTPLVGLHNLENVFAAIAGCIGLGLDAKVIAEGVENLKNVPGRLEKFVKDDNYIFVDYAHTDDALMNVLSSLTPFIKNRLIALFGCGGDRDRTKRPRMAKAAEEYADTIYVTNDNPRSEEPMQIIEDILEGFENAEKVIITPDRGEAIAQAMDSLTGGDILLIAGKGHEDYMIVKDERMHFDDREEVRKNLEQSL